MACNAQWQNILSLDIHNKPPLSLELIANEKKFVSLNSLCMAVSIHILSTAKNKTPIQTCINNKEIYYSHERKGKFQGQLNPMAPTLDSLPWAFFFFFP